MATVYLTPQLRRFVDVPSMQVSGETLSDVLSNVFRAHPALRGYVLDDQGAIRQHVAVFIDGRQATDREGQSDLTGPDSEVHIFQALSGG